MFYCHWMQAQQTERLAIQLTFGSIKLDSNIKAGSGILLYKVSTAKKDGHPRIIESPSQHILLDEPRAHKSFQGMDISLDLQFLASTLSDGAARIWKITDGIPLISLTRNSDEKIGCCRFSRDGTKPFLFCTAQKGKTCHEFET